MKIDCLYCTVYRKVEETRTPRKDCKTIFFLHRLPGFAFLCHLNRTTLLGTRVLFHVRSNQLRRLLYNCSVCQEPTVQLYRQGNGISMASDGGGGGYRYLCFYKVILVILVESNPRNFPEQCCGAGAGLFCWSRSR